MRQQHRQESQHQHCRKRRHPSALPCACLRPLIRVAGLLTSFVICGVGVDVYMHGYQAGLYILLSALLVLFIEIKWLITIFLQLLCGGIGDDNYHRVSNCLCCLHCWRYAALLLGGWRPAPLYVAVGVSLAIWPHNLWLSYVAGMFMLLLALLRLCTLLRFSCQAKDEGLLPHCDFEKVSGLADIAEDDFVEFSAKLDEHDQDEEDAEEEPMDDVC